METRLLSQDSSVPRPLQSPLGALRHSLAAHDQKDSPYEPPPLYSSLLIYTLRRSFTHSSSTPPKSITPRSLFLNRSGCLWKSNFLLIAVRRSVTHGPNVFFFPSKLKVTVSSGKMKPCNYSIIHAFSSRRCRVWPSFEACFRAPPLYFGKRIVFVQIERSRRSHSCG